MSLRMSHTCPIKKGYVSFTCPFTKLYVSHTSPTPYVPYVSRTCPPLILVLVLFTHRHPEYTRPCTHMHHNQFHLPAAPDDPPVWYNRKPPGLSGTGGGRRTRWRPVSRPSGRKRREMGRGILRRGQQQQLKPECACCDATATLLRNAIHEHSASDASWELRSRGAGICRPHRCRCLRGQIATGPGR